MRKRKIRVKKFRDYFSEQTAVIANQIGDSILVLGSGASLISLDSAPHWVTYMFISFTLGGKLVTKLFADDNEG